MNLASTVVFKTTILVGDKVSVKLRNSKSIFLNFTEILTFRGTSVMCMIYSIYWALLKCHIYFKQLKCHTHFTFVNNLIFSSVSSNEGFSMWSPFISYKRLMVTTFVFTCSTVTIQYLMYHSGLQQCFMSRLLNMVTICPLKEINGDHICFTCNF